MERRTKIALDQKAQSDLRVALTVLGNPGGLPGESPEITLSLWKIQGRTTIRLRSDWEGRIRRGGQMDRILQIGLDCGRCGKRRITEDLHAFAGEGSSYPGDSADQAAAELDPDDPERFLCVDCTEEIEVEAHEEAAEMSRSDGLGAGRSDRGATDRSLDR